MKLDGHDPVFLINMMDTLGVRRSKHFRRAVFTELDNPDPPTSDDRERLWRWVLHEDDILATRMSSFLLTQSILIAITAGVISALAGLHSAHRTLRIEVFGLSLALGVAGIFLTLAFWHIVNINHNGIRVMTRELRNLDALYKRLDEQRQSERRDRVHFGTVLDRRGVYWVINNLQPAAILVTWLLVLGFAAAIFLSG